MRPDDLPDCIHIEALREALWRPESRAAALVGAGMSRNADKLSPAVPDFPSWTEIASGLRSAVDPGTSELDPLRLGQMVEDTCGRGRLDDLLLDLIPDGKYEPGPLHQRLLQLPWADVFTTNHDTLLERARRRAPERKYEIVEAPADLTRAERPRIVKLHGSLPARRRFIFTEEDYRRYPADFAPFVSLVRQSATENVLCLVGFSGSDPDFLQWAGWLRDQLGATAPRLYLCGVLDLTTLTRSYYRHLQVIPVDLGPLFPPRDWPLPGERHRAALAWLLESLHAGEPIDLRRWPRLDPPASAVALAAPSPPLLAPPAAPEPPPRLDRPRGALDQATLAELLTCWKGERAAYPGWAVCPEPARIALWQATSQWFRLFDGDGGARLLAELPLAARAEALREIAWRAETALVPLPGALPPLIEQTLERINPLPRLIDLPGASLTPSAATPSLRWDDLAEVWVELAFSLVRHAWQLQDAALHERWMERLRRVAAVRSTWRARWWYATCWHHLIRLEADEALQASRDWPGDPSLPLWEAKRAAVLAELGLLEEAREIAARALERVRLGRDRARVDHRSLSEEGWLLLLLQVIAVYAPDLSDPYRMNDRRERRFRELARDDGNPWDDLHAREHAVLEEDTSMRVQRARGFDPGAARGAASWSSGRASAWALLDTLHHGPELIFAQPALRAALRQLWSTSPRLVVGLLIRAGANSALDEGEARSGLLDRAAIARLPAAEVDVLYAWLSSALPAALARRAQDPSPRVHDDHGDRRRIEGAAEVLSRLAFRLSEAELTALFELTRTLSTSAVFQREFMLHAPLERLLRRVLHAATAEQLASWMGALLAFPMPEEPGVKVSELASWAEPFSLLRWSDLPPLTPSDGARWTPVVGRLLTWAREGSPELRRRSSRRLAALAFAGALTQDQLESLAGAVWSRTDAHVTPADIGVSPSVLLRLPERRPGEARGIVLGCLRDARHMAPFLQSLKETTAPIAEVHEGGVAAPRIAWTAEEALLLLDKLIAFWQAESPSPPELGPLRGWRARETISDVSATVATALVPYLDPADRRAREQVMALAGPLRRHETAAVVLLPSLLLLGVAEPDHVAVDLHRALLGVRGEDVSDGVSALLIWIDLGQAGRLAPPPAHLLDVLVACVETGRHPGLPHTLAGVTALLSRKRPPLEARHLEALSRALRCFIETTDLDRTPGDGAAADDLPLDAVERIAVVERASALAAALATVHHAAGAAEPTAIAAWRELAGVHVLPEVRRPWRARVRATAGMPSGLAPTVLVPLEGPPAPARSA
ncbi:SIR2 family protein [Sorangium sp. So ce131]|uniref:SIR2 family protein n=1 Tax=Sorangium sp. So ce131 TaxID=3133282 RepID=UPI003F5EDE0B